MKAQENVAELREPDTIERALRVLVVDDEPRIRKILTRCREGDGHRVAAVGSAPDALEAAGQESFEVAFLDQRLGTASGLDLIPELLRQMPHLKIIVITAYASVETAVEAMRRGASDYLAKPFTPAQVRLALRKAVDLQALENRVDLLQEDLARSRPATHLESRSPVMQRALDEARQVAESDATVLLRGESGTGKNVLARAIHGWSRRAGRPFVVVHGPSLSAELFESELFGHIKGAFTGAEQDNPGRVARADGGTLFLDEIGDLPLALQPKLLRFAQEHAYERVGDPETRSADVRLLAATNQDLQAAIVEGRFREDLFYRLNVIEITVPPLRERPEDLLPLARRFLTFFADKYNRAVEGFSEETEATMRGHAWPGNVRELQNAVERAVILCRDAAIRPEHLPFASDRSAAPARVGGAVTLAELEEAHIRRIIEAAETLGAAARTLGIDPATLWRRRKQYGL